jgi:phosphatidylserine decarboxylase
LKWTYVPATTQRDGLLRVTVIEAKELTAADKSGTSDPYCVLKLGTEKRETKPVKKTLNPVWNTTFEL